MPKLSSITITGNEGANIADCIDGLKFCDERIVVDGGSKDDTVAIAEKLGRNGLSSSVDQSWQTKEYRTVARDR
jgi:glycosyltransferase involved in cell wall biosynthesis